MWQNDLQQYIPVGTLIYDVAQRSGFVGFSYDKSYLDKELPPIDPAHLTPDRYNRGKYVVKEQNGNLPHYFTSFLPGEFGQRLISEVNHKWDSLSQAERLYVTSLTHGDFGAPQLNPQNVQQNNVINDMDDLNALVRSIRAFQGQEIRSIISPSLQASLCSSIGAKPKIEFQSLHGKQMERFIVKLNSANPFNDARVSVALTKLEQIAGISVCNNRAVSLDCGEEALFSSNYSRTESHFPEDLKCPINILKYNRISFRVLLAEDPILENTERPLYSHIVHAINKYSCDPISDKEELFRRAVFSASTNNTSNGLENMEMYDTGGGNWRLSPSFQNLPNPLKDAYFDTAFSNRMNTSNLFELDEIFIATLGTSFDYSPFQANVIAQPVINSLSQFISKNQSANIQLTDLDRKSLLKCMKITEVIKLDQLLLKNDKVMEQVNSKEINTGYTNKPSGPSIG